MKTLKQDEVHKSVLVNEVNKNLEVDKLAHLKSQAKIIDATVGAGGHAAGFVERGIFVLGIDTDLEMLDFAKTRLIKACPASNPGRVGSCFQLVHANFKNIDRVASDCGIDDVNGVLFDLGVSSYQLTSKTKGISFSNPKAMLDMRLNNGSNIMAKDILNLSSYDDLVSIFESTCGYVLSRRLAKNISDKRKIKHFETVEDLLLVITESLPKSHRKIDPATLPFMALRIAVNNELENLDLALPKAFELLGKRGRLCVISFHSGEDRLVKHFMKNVIAKGLAETITKKPLRPSEKEIAENRRSRSATLRVIEKV